MSEDKRKPSTRLIHDGRQHGGFDGAVNPPIRRASTILTDDVSELYGGAKSLYGRMGTDTQETLSNGLKSLENAEHVQLAPTGLSGCALAMASVLNSGDHFLMTDSAYGPSRRFAERYLARMGVTTTFFDPRITADAFAALITPETKAAFFEMPGSLTFELHDLNALLPLCKQHNIITILDNTWAAGVFFKPLDAGVDISVQALTKYVIGHSDGFGGAAMTNDRRIALKLDQTANDWGVGMSPDDAYLAQRGLRTLHSRITQQGRTALNIAEWLAEQSEVKEVYHPALSTHPDNAIFNDLFSGASGLFSFALYSEDAAKLDRFFKTFQLFGFGFSWGGFESLILPCNPQLKRSTSDRWKSGSYGTLVRVQIGLEDEADLTEELQQALSELH